MAHSNLSRPIDSLLVLRAAGEDPETETGSESTSVDLGLGSHRFDVFFDVNECEADSDDELYLLHVWGSPDATAFASNTYLLATLALGAAGALGTTVSRADGEYVLPVIGVANVDGQYVYCRHFKVAYTISGTVLNGIDFTAHISRHL
jgi:hypothetical protein